MAEICGSPIPRNFNDPNAFCLTKEEYLTNYWPTIQGAIRYLLSQPDGNCSTLSYERVYGSVYNCVCRHFGEQLFKDLCNEVRDHYDAVKNELLQASEDDLINIFDCVLRRFKTALDGIIPLFNCMNYECSWGERKKQVVFVNRFYLGSKLETDLKTELSNIFIAVVANDVVHRVLRALERAQSIPFAADPAAVARVVKGLHCLNKDYSSLAPAIFARYIPNILPPMQLSDLPNFVAETQQYQEQLRSMGFISGDQSRKRSGEELSAHSFHASEY